MIEILYRADPNLLGQRVKLLTSSRTSVDSEIAGVETGPWDHVVRSLSDLPAPVAGLISLTAGSWAFPEALNIGANIIVVPGGVECHLKGFWGKFLTGTSTNLIAVNGVAFLETMALSNDAPLLLSGVGGICHCLACDIFAVSACVLTTVAFGHFAALGGYWQRFGGTPPGLYVNCNVDRIQIQGVSGVNLTHFVRRVAGTVGAVLVEGCTTKACTNGITWAAANMPTRGLIVVNNEFDCVTPFNGFTAATALVNAKANINAAGLMSETGIVP